MKKLRLLLFSDCDRACPGCCNKDWDLDALPVCDSYEGYDEVLITGGEPLLKPGITRMVIRQIRQENPKAKIYIYTAKLDDKETALDVLKMCDGFTLTLHEQADVQNFVFFHAAIPDELFENRSLRLNVFKGLDLFCGDGGWESRFNLEWKNDCPLPADEVFMRLSASDLYYGVNYL